MPPAPHHDTRKSANDSIASLAEIADHLRRMQNTAHEQIPPRSYRPDMERAANEGAFSQRVRDDMDRIGDSVRLLAAQSGDTTTLGVIEDTHSQQNPTSPDGDILRQIDDRLNEISRAIIVSNRTSQPDQDKGRRLERIEDQLLELSEQLNSSAVQLHSDALYRKLGELSQRIEVLGANASLPDRVVEQLAQQVNLLANQVGKVMENLSQSEYCAVDARLEAINHKLEAAEKRAEEPHPSVLDKIDRRFAELTERLDAQYVHSSQHVDTQAIHTLEGRLDDISQQISLGLLQTAQYGNSGLADNEAIRSLENQIANIARHLAEPVAELAQIRPRLDSIERSITSNKEAVLDAAREAAENAVARVLQHGSQNDTAIARQLADDMKSLEVLARNADERNGKTFEAVHDTLVKIVDRLATLERDLGSKAETGSDAENSSSLTNPVAAQRSAPPRSPATAAAQAAFATIQSESATAGKLNIETTGKPSLFGGFAKTICGQRVGKTESGTGNAPEARSVDNLGSPSFESDLAAIDPIIRTEPERAPEQSGEGMPDLNSIMRRVREERRQREDAADAALATNGKVDFITAARRAAQLAATESEQLQKGAVKGTGKKKSSVGDILQRQRKPILMAIGAIMIAMAGLQIGSAFLKRDKSVETTIDAAPQEAEVPVSSAAITPVDEVGAQNVTQAPEVLQEAAPAPQMVEPRHENVQTENTATAASTSELETTPAPEQTGAPAESAALETPSTLTAIPAIPKEAGPAALREAAAKGDTRALFEIGNRYMEGREVTADFAKAAKWYDYAAAQGFAPAQYRLGNFNEKGLGMPRDLKKAKTWYQLSAQQGNASAMHNLAVLFASGANGTPDNTSAVRWFTDAAELGVKDSQFNLGILAAKGIGMPVSLEESYKWFALAAKAGDTDAAEKRDEIAKAMKPEQLERAKAAVELWKVKPLNEATNSIDVPDAWTEDKVMTTGSVDMKKAVRNIQLILQKNGYDVGTADGLMGIKTRSAISAFQKANGQKPTGEVDQKLVQLLLEKNK